MHFMDALQYPMQDKGWLGKIVIAVLLLIIPFVNIITGIFVVGYGVRMIQQIYRRQPGLPEWDDWGGDFSRGIMVVIGAIIYFVPTIIIACCNAGLGQSDSGGAAALSCLLSLISFVYSLAVTPLLFSAVAHYAVNENFSAFTDIAGRIQDVTGNFGNTVMLYIDLIIFYVIAYIIMFIGFILCILPGLFVIGYVSIALYYMIAQWGIQIGAANAASGGQYMGPPPQQGGFSF